MYYYFSKRFVQKLEIMTHVEDLLLLINLALKVTLKKLLNLVLIFKSFFLYEFYTQNAISFLVS